MNNQIDLIDALVREGETNKARTEFLKINRSQIDRKYYGLYANISWRIGEADLGLRLLSPILKQKKNLLKEVSERETAEYANCLTSAGCSQEALALLRTKSNSWALQARAFAHISQWEYQEALDCLLKVIEKKDISEYSLLVSKINSVACLVFLEKWDLVFQSVKEISQLHSSHLSARLKMNLHGLILQSYTMTGNYEEAERLIKSTGIQASGGYDALIIEKWQAVLQSRLGGDHESLLKIRDKAATLKRWETVRDCEFHIATITKNCTFFNRVYFGTPYPSFRKKIARHFSMESPIPDHFDFWLHSAATRESISTRPQFNVDITNGKIGEFQIKVGSHNHSLLKYLCSDLYKPKSLGSLFYGLFPNEQFDPVNSPNRVHQHIKALRDFFIEHNIPLKLEENSGRYMLETDSIVALKLPANININPLYQTRIESIQHLLGTEFTKSDIIKHLNCSPKTAQRLLADAVERGFCVKFGQSRNTKFIKLPG